VDREGLVRLWTVAAAVGGDTATWTPVASLHGHARFISGAALDPYRAVTASWDSLRLWVFGGPGGPDDPAMPLAPCEGVAQQLVCGHSADDRSAGHAAAAAGHGRGCGCGGGGGVTGAGAAVGAVAGSGAAPDLTGVDAYAVVQASVEARVGAPWYRRV
jgi:hypothetical protein